MGRKNLVLPVLQCEYCDFSTKNIYIYKRHKIRCRKEHGVGAARFDCAAGDRNAEFHDEGNQHSTDMLETSEVMPQYETIESGPELSSSESTPVPEGISIMGASTSSFDSTSVNKTVAKESGKTGKQRAAVNRNYTCIKCNFRTNKSRLFLYHLVDMHNSNTDIYSCRVCEYCSRYKHKIQRHMIHAHKLDIPYDKLIPEHRSNIKQKTPLMRKVQRKPIMSKTGAGRGRLMVKFVKPSSGVNTSLTPPQARVVSSLVKKPSPTIHPTDQLARVVEEIYGEDGRTIFKCKECQFTSDDKHKVAKHAVSWHVDTKSFTCSHCDYITFERNDFLTHRMTHRNEHQFRCEECTYSTDFRPNFDRHLNNHRSTFPFKCSFCSYGCGSDAAIRRHMACNHDPVPPPAKKMKLPVPKSVASTSTLATTEPLTVLSEHLPSSLLKESSLSPALDQPMDITDNMNQSPQRLMFTLDSNSISMVPRPTLPIPNLENAGMLGRELSPQRKLPVNITQYVQRDEGKLVCPVCNLKYKRSSDLNRHMKRKHGCRLREYLENYDDSSLDVNMSNTSASDQSMGDEYNTQYVMTNDGDMDDDEDDDNDDEDDYDDDDNDDLNELKGDIPLNMAAGNDGDNDGEDLEDNREEVSHVSPEELKCKYCNFQAKWPSDLRRHHAVHSIQKRFKCNFCPKKYKYIGDMNVHIRKDHNREPAEVKVVKVATMSKKKTSPAIFRCPCCNYTSAWKSEVDRHSRLHTGEKTFQCCNCDYQTFWRGDIRRHVYKHHPDLMKEGVAINDVIKINKERSPDLMAMQNNSMNDSSLDLKLEEGDNMNESMDTRFATNTDYHTPDAMTTRSDAHTHEGSPEINMDDNFERSVIGHSPTPSPIKELGGGLYKCQYCGFVANAPSKMNSHIATHTNLKRYMCPLCGRRANWKWDIAKHIKKDHSDQMSQVIKLSKQDAEETIQAYMEANPVVRRDHHLNTTPEKTSPEIEEKFFKCSACDFSAEKRISIARHIRYMHTGKTVNIVVKKASPKKNRSTPTIQAQGQEAAKSLYSSTQIVTPSKYTHLVENFGPQDAARPFMCSECGKRGATKGDVKKHYHYLHADKEIRIIYLGDGSQSVYSAKSDIGHSTTDKSQKSSKSSDNTASRNSTSPGSSRGGDGFVSRQPKVLGYIRPFKCGLCGRRSNWRWDLNKHIRERHPGQNIEVITLSEEEARATVEEYVAKFAPELNKVSGSVPRKRHKNKQLAEPAVAPLMPVIPSKPVQSLPSKGVFKQFKCSGCAYRSNWRTDIQRHINRRHGALRAKVLYLDKDVAEATLETYTYTRGSPGVKIPKSQTMSTTKSAVASAKYDTNSPSMNNSFAQTNYTLNEPSFPAGPLPKKAWAGLEKKIWKCSMCLYSNVEKVDVLKHLSKHNMKAYKCTLCNWTSNSKSGVQGHIGEVHPGDSSAMCRLSIKLIKEGPGLDQSGQSIMPGHVSQDGHVPVSMSLSNKEPLDIVQAGKSKLALKAANPNTVMFHCKLCHFRSSWRSCVCRHIRTNHNSKDYTGLCVKKVVRSGAVSAVSNAHLHAARAVHEIRVSPNIQVSGSVPDSPNAKDSLKSRPKNFKCDICPYKTCKAKMLKFHLTCHTPQPGVKQVKCKYCPYYVNGSRLLTQHTNLHLKEFRSENRENIIDYPRTPVKSTTRRIPRSPAIPKRYRCEKCPYSTNSKNDFLYHKQFHRPKPTADFKCDYCDYWVTHRRLIKQHMKVHREHEGCNGYASETASPSKSEYSENSLVYDTVEIAAIKQRIIASKITPSISQTPVVSPMKIASTCSVGGKRGFLRKDGGYRKVHKCHHCPYMNIRLRNMKLHELMHGKRSASHPLMKCPHCDYYVGSKGLLAHHLKVHQPDYGVEFVGHERHDSVASEDSEIDINIPMENKVDTLLEIARFKKYGCEKCPYATSKRSHFQRHVELHGSRQKCKCDFCDYSVPTQNLLSQHTKLHFEPNQNLLAAQSILNLQFLPEMPADVALASMMANNDSKHPVSITHDHIDLYENAPEDLEPKKLYRCDRCPYANVRRDHLLAHLRCHMIKNEYACPYCDYSVGKTHVLMQHVKVHFSPLPELSEWLSDNGDPERVKEVKEKNLKEVLEVVKMYQSEKKASKLAKDKQEEVNEAIKTDTADNVDKNENKSTEQVKAESLTTDENNKTRNEKNISKEDVIDTAVDAEVVSNMEVQEYDDPEVSFKMKDQTELKAEDGKIFKVPATTGNPSTELLKIDGTEIPKEEQEKEDVEIMIEVTDIGKPRLGAETCEVVDGYICQYCDRDFLTSDCLVRHEMQHLIGNSYEDLVLQLVQRSEQEVKQDQEKNEKGEQSNTHTHEQDENKDGNSCNQNETVLNKRVNLIESDKVLTNGHAVNDVSNVVEREEKTNKEKTEELMVTNNDSVKGGLDSTKQTAMETE